MKKYLIRLGLFALLLSGFLYGAAQQIFNAQKIVVCCLQDEQQVKTCDGRIRLIAEEPDSAPVSTLRSSPSSPRVASTRPARLLPTYGGKPNSHSGRWAKEQSSNYLNCFVLQPCMRLYRLYTVVASPRRYYVIALRRLLC
ncbi:MAG: hypothetical protein K5896_10155 [Prevotella sp.]|nr:hypothetical protein [Prevotella sp.]